MRISIIIYTQCHSYWKCHIVVRKLHVYYVIVVLKASRTRLIHINYQNILYSNMSLDTCMLKKCKNIIKCLCTHHKLSKERFRGALPSSERVCMFCLNYINVRVIENEYHFISVCPLYAHFRATMLPNLINNNSFNTFCSVMSSDKQSVNSNLFKYIYILCSRCSQYV